MIYKSLEDLIGHTPCIELSNLERDYNLASRLLAKLEFCNPAGSAKDRVAKQMIEDYEASGVLKSDSVIIEPTSGNTGIGLAMIAAVRGYRAIIVMPDTMSEERRKLMRAYGAELVLSDGSKGMAGAIEKAEEIRKSIPGSIIAGQFTNPSNPKAHYVTTGPEIWDDTDGEVDYFVAGIGTGGTITGTGKYLKEMNPEVKIIGIEPAGSPFITEGKKGAHDLQGIGAGFIPEILDTSVYDEIITVTDEEAYKYGRLMGTREGALVGITSGAALCGAMKIAQRPEAKGKTIVAFMPDTGSRYLSTKMFL